MKIPNILTLCRLLGAPLFLWAFLAEGQPARWWALGLAITFEITDLLDGFVARRFQQGSQLGKILDPLADSVSRFTIFLAFLVRDYADVWAIACIFYRDSIVSTVRILAASQGVIVSARWSGKLKAVVQGGVIAIILSASALRGPLGLSESDVAGTIAQPLMWFVAGVTLMSLADYVLGNRSMLQKLDR